MRRWKTGPISETHRPFRRWETAPDRYVFPGQSQALWAFSQIHPWLWRAYRFAAQVRCFFRGHEGSALWEDDKYVSNPKSRRNCLFCGKEQIWTPDLGSRIVENPRKAPQPRVIGR